MDTDVDKAYLIKTVSAVYKNSKKQASDNKCLICREEVTSFCKSHTLPRFILNTLSKDGNVYTLHPAIWSQVDPHIKEEVGIGKADIFYALCRRCDSIWFQVYENPEKWHSFNSLSPSEKQKMMGLIFLKNMCRNYYNTLGNREFYRKAELTSDNLDTSHIQLSEKYDLLDYSQHIQIAVNGLKVDSPLYKILYYKKVHYPLPVATQCTVAPQFDLNGHEINNMLDLESEMHYLTVCIFPMRECSYILVFTLKRSVEKFRDMFASFNRLTDSEKGKYLLALSLAHTADQVFFSHHAYMKIKENRIAKELTEMNLPASQCSSANGVVCFGIKRPDLSGFKLLPDLFN